MTSLKKVLTLKEVSPMAHRLTGLKTDLLIARAEELRKEIKQGVKKPFKEVIEVHSGDGQAMGTKPVTFIRQVMAACFYPELLQSDRLPRDVKFRAQELLQQCGGSVGVYSDTFGLEYVQHNVARFIEERDGGVPCDPQNIYLTAGSQKAGQLLLNLLVHTSGCGSGPCGTGVLVPVPCSPWFSLALQEAGGVRLPYFLADQGVCWELDVQELQRVVQSARGHCTPSVLYINNPGNPTGHVQSRQSIEEVIRFAASEGLYLLVDEESQSHLSSLSRNAALVVESLDRIPGIRVLSPQGGFFCFPRIHIPPLVVHEAETQGLSPDLFYCLRFLEEWGVAVGPGSDFGAREGSHHIRLNLLLPHDKLKSVLESLEKFHLQFTEEFS